MHVLATSSSQQQTYIYIRYLFHFISLLLFFIFRSLKGGKREWVYHNIRPKDHTEVDVWHGSNKHLTLNATPESYLSGVSLLPFQHFVLDKQPSPENESVQKSLTSLFHRLDGEENVCSTVEEPSRNTKRKRTA